jgi:hypothetical protein
MIDTTIVLPAPEVEALLQGRTIVAIVSQFIEQREFAIYPYDASNNILPISQYYRSNFLPAAQIALAKIPNEITTIAAWARCELCQIIDRSEPLKALSLLTIWQTEALQEIVKQREYIFLAYLRVYKLTQALDLSFMADREDLFVPFLPALNTTEDAPVLSDRLFTKRFKQLINRLPPLHPELEDLQGAIAQLATINPDATQLDRDIQIFLDWNPSNYGTKVDPDLKWIATIADVGNSSDGNAFEKLVRRSFVKLGFSNYNTKLEASLDPDSTGGAGGLDFYCETPYPVVGECKATKHETVTDGTPAQLIKLGNKHLQAQYNRCIKIIMAAGKLNTHAQQTAKNNQMNVLRPETLQRLVELKAKHQGSIDLFELKPLLEKSPFGEEADAKVNSYIDRVQQDIKLRSHVIQVLKKYLENTHKECAGVEAIHGAYSTSNPPKRLNSKELNEILIELSSPLTGYLGRKKGEDWRRDRFYFLRDLPM